MCLCVFFCRCFFRRKHFVSLGLVEGHGVEYFVNELVIRSKALLCHQTALSGFPASRASWQSAVCF